MSHDLQAGPLSARNPMTAAASTVFHRATTLLGDDEPLGLAGQFEGGWAKVNSSGAAVASR